MHNRQQGHITETDLQRYASSHNLPAAYVRPFMAALTAQPLVGSSEEEEAGAVRGDDGAVGFRRFRRFVVTREEGLREAFNMFDKGELWLSSGGLGIESAGRCF